MPFPNMNFFRFDRNTDRADFKRDFKYETKKGNDVSDRDFHAATLDKTGFCLYYNVQNFMAEAVMLGGNLRAIPTRIKSLRQRDVRPRDDVNNFVIITIYSSENSSASDPRRRTTQTTKTEIRVPGAMLSQGSVFINELDCYLMTESQIDATRELIARDVSHPNWDRVNVPTSIAKQDPAALYIQYKELVEYCILRQDKINIRVGVDLRYGVIPDILKTMRVAILDSYFVPYDVYKLVYDPTLGEDEFVIENLLVASSQEFRATLSELKRLGSIYLDHDEVGTMFGTFYGMAIFPGETQYVDYVYQRKTQERFRDETLFVAEQSGDPRLKEEISRLERELSRTQESEAEKDSRITELKETNKNLKATVKERDDAITKIRQNYDGRMRAEVVLSEIENERERVANEGRKIGNDRLELGFKERSAVLTHRSTMLKNIADILKSGWGITTACAGGVLSVIALCKKYNVKLVMGT